jgi:hypothetical protein
MRRGRRRALLFLLLVLPVLLVAPPASADDDCKPIDDFAKARLGEFPAEWKARKDAGRSVYSVIEEGGLRFLRAVSKGLGIQAARELADWDLGGHPILAWSWRPREFPKGADERESGTNDSVLAVYMLVPYSRIVGPRAVKYVWSEKVPTGTRLTSNSGLTQVRVLRSGLEGRGQWWPEKVNVLEDYRKFFEVSDAPKPAGIAVLTDADDTKSSAAGDYTDFRICRR